MVDKQNAAPVGSVDSPPSIIFWPVNQEWDLWKSMYCNMFLASHNHHRPVARAFGEHTRVHENVCTCKNRTAESISACQLQIDHTSLALETHGESSENKLRTQTCRKTSQAVGKNHAPRQVTRISCMSSKSQCPGPLCSFNTCEVIVSFTKKCVFSKTFEAQLSTSCSQCISILSLQQIGWTARPPVHLYSSHLAQPEKTLSRAQACPKIPWGCVCVFRNADITVP